MRLVLDGVGKRLGGRAVLDAVGLEASAGSITGLIGPNGAGKSTLLRIAAGLLAADAGSVSLDGVALDRASASARARAIAYLPQARTVHWPVSVEALVGLGRLASHSGDAADRAATKRAIELLDLGSLRARPVTELSGGELARVLVARALAQETAVLLADEPAAALDPAHQLALFAILARQAAAGQAIVVALHDLSLAARFCDRLVLLKDGRIVAEGAAEAVLTPRLLAVAYGIDAHVGRIGGVPVVVPLGPAGD